MHGNGLIRLVAHAFPEFPGVGDLLGGRITLDQQPRARRDLREWRVLGEIPDHRRENVLSLSRKGAISTVSYRQW